ncbi:hypothetical protein ACLQ2P_26225 [Actinomadura citrea]|uniref:hypothetical protein n=1 Tax=Actinomadura citrea TaxID=46158 RepID=UPI003CE4B5B2
MARSFADEGARVFLTARIFDVIDTVAKEISAAGGAVETAVVDAGDEKSHGVRAICLRTTGMVETPVIEDGYGQRAGDHQ